MNGNTLELTNLLDDFIRQLDYYALQCRTPSAFNDNTYHIPMPSKESPWKYRDPMPMYEPVTVVKAWAIPERYLFDERDAYWEHPNSGRPPGARRGPKFNWDPGERMGSTWYWDGHTSTSAQEPNYSERVQRDADALADLFKFFGAAFGKSIDEDIRKAKQKPVVLSTETHLELPLPHRPVIIKWPPRKPKPKKKVYVKPTYAPMPARLCTFMGGHRQGQHIVVLDTERNVGPYRRRGDTKTFVLTESIH